jgi:hypothetical protein
MMRAVMVVVGLAAAAIVFFAIWIDKGEVVTLLTTDADSMIQDTQLWVVELEGVYYLRASNARAAWLARLGERPLVELEFGDTSRHYRAVPLDDAALRSRINAAMARKYGFADRLWGVMRDCSETVSIRLEPAPNPESLGDAS